MGVVYRANQPAVGREVALKLLSPELSHDPSFRERFRREGQMQATMNHPNIVPVYEMGDSPQGFFIAMPLIPGPTLKELILEEEIDSARTLRLLRGVAAGLDAAHAAGLI